MSLTTTPARAMWIGAALGGGLALVGLSQRYFAWPLTLEDASGIATGTLGGALFWGLVFRFAFGRKPPDGTK